jgi:hypothetical protein
MKHLKTFEKFTNKESAPVNERALDQDLVGAIATIMRICDERYQEYFDRGRKATADTWKDIKEDMVKISKTMERFNEQESMNESTNRWYNTMLALGKLGVEFKWFDELAYKPKGLVNFVDKHFPGVDSKNLAILFKKDVGSKWDKAKQVLGGVLGDDSDSGEFVIVNSLTA